MISAALLAAARRAQAAYIDEDLTARAAFAKLQLTVLGRYENADHLAVLSRDAAGATYLSISGTRFTDGKIGDLGDDVRDSAVDLGGGAKVTSGAYAGLDALWAWVERLAPNAALTVEGHSLGGWRARYTGLFLPPERIVAVYSFEAPKGGNAEFWATQAPLLAKLTSVVNGRDVFVAWPFLGGWCHPDKEVIWLTGKGYEVIHPSAWPGPLLLTDHSMDLVVERLAALVAT